MLCLVQVAAFHNMFVVLNSPRATQLLPQLVVDLMHDARIEVIGEGKTTTHPHAQGQGMQTCKRNSCILGHDCIERRDDVSNR